MLKQIIISPYSRMLRTGKQNAKNYPWWKEVVEKLHLKEFNVIQIGDGNQTQVEQPIGADEILMSLSLDQLKQKVSESNCWASVDNFFPHLCSFIPHKPGVVIFGISDPIIFGYPHNINLVKDRKYLRPRQFEIWETADFSQSVFVEPDIVVDAVLKVAG